MRSFSILIFGFFALVFLFSCLNSKNHKEVQQETILSSGNFCFNNNIDSLLHIFIQKANCHGCYYEMYIEKKDENETLLCLRASLKYPEGINSDELLNDYLMKRNPMLYLIKDNETVFIYSGIENLVIPQTFDHEIEFHKDTSSYFEYTWVIKKIKQEYMVYEDTWVNPFDKIDFKSVIKYEIPDSINKYNK